MSRDDPCRGTLAAIGTRRIRGAGGRIEKARRSGLERLAAS
jgi:hypothetical protein